MNNFTKIQDEMLQKENLLVQMADVFGALASDCRLEIIYLLLRVESLGSGEIGRLTNCSASQISQYLSKMYDAGLVKKSRTWREVEYSLDKSDSFVQGIISILSIHMK